MSLSEGTTLYLCLINWIHNMLIEREVTLEEMHYNSKMLLKCSVHR
jgi:hypothetical protein